MVKPADDYRGLSIAERLRLVEDIWDSIAQDTGAVPVPPEVLDEAERRQFGLRGREIAVSQFTTDNLIPQYEELYERMLDRRK